MKSDALGRIVVGQLDKLLDVLEGDFKALFEDSSDYEPKEGYEKTVYALGVQEGVKSTIFKLRKLNQEFSSSLTSNKS